MKSLRAFLIGFNFTFIGFALALNFQFFQQARRTAAELGWTVEAWHFLAMAAAVNIIILVYLVYVKVQTVKIGKNF